MNIYQVMVLHVDKVENSPHLQKDSVIVDQDLYHTGTRLSLLWQKCVYVAFQIKVMTK